MPFLFLDDDRVIAEVTWVDLPQGDWTIVRTVEAFKQAVTEQMPTYVSFDHDLAQKQPDGTELNGYTAALWLRDYCLETKQELPAWSVHSKNCRGRKDITDLLNTWERAKSIYYSNIPEASL